MMMKQRRGLDLCCGRGGWSYPFIVNGWQMIGIDIKKMDYPGDFIQADIRDVDGTQFRNFDLIIGSPPCVDFSDARFRSRHIHGKNPDPEKGMELIREFERIVEEAQPKIWLMENIRKLEQFYRRKPIWRFYISKGGRRSLWGNINIPFAPGDFRFRHKIRDIPGWEKTRWKRSFIPWNISSFIHKVVMEKLQ